MKAKGTRVVVLGYLLLVWLPVSGLCDWGSDRRRELDAQARELREAIRVLENEKDRLSYSGADLQRRRRLSDLISAKRAELSAVDSLRARLIGSTKPQPIRPQETQLHTAETRTRREEIRTLETRKSQLGYSGADLQLRRELDDLIHCKRAALSAAEAVGMNVGSDTASNRWRERRVLEAEVRELAQEIRWLESEKNRLGYTAADLRRRSEIADLICSKRALMAIKEQRRLKSE